MFTKRPAGVIAETSDNLVVRDDRVLDVTKIAEREALVDQSRGHPLAQLRGSGLTETLHDLLVGDERILSTIEPAEHDTLIIKRIGHCLA